MTAAEAAWTRAIAIDESNAAGWSNRGVLRLQVGDYSGAASDLEKSAELERKAFSYASGFTLCALGNARGAAGDWDGAIDAYEEAELDDYSGVAQLARAYTALAQYELGFPELATKSARDAIADPETPPEAASDMRAALAGFLFAAGDAAAADEVAAPLGGKATIAAAAEGYKQARAGGWAPKAAAAVADYAASP